LKYAKKHSVFAHNCWYSSRKSRFLRKKQENILPE